MLKLSEFKGWVFLDQHCSLLQRYYPAY